MRRCQRVRIKRFMCRTWSHSHCLVSYFFLDDDFFFPEDFFFEVVFFEEDFFLEADFLAGTFAPALRASESPMAFACLRLVTFLPDFPLLRVPCFFSCMTFLTFDCAFLPYRAIVFSWAVRATYRIQCPPAHLEQDRFQMFQREHGLRIEGQRRVLDCMVDQGVDGICILANYPEQFLLIDAERDPLLDVGMSHVVG